ncbi:MAG: sugar ABC transporter substrate-binding protein [Acidobacteriia bacterium]|nr:sugar ABC transporter substrate-binding protein [Terriglobia bacterium]
MTKPRVVVSLPNDNAYLHEQELAAKRAGERLGFDLLVLHANDDAVTQSQQLLEIIQSRSEPRPSAFMVEPVVHTGLRRVAEVAVEAGMAWVVSNANVDYLPKLRTSSKIPVFSISQDHREIGRLQGKQMATLLPQGGSVLYIQGPSSSTVATERTEGMERIRPSNLQLTTLRSKWGEEGAFQSTCAWLKLATSRPERYDLVAGHSLEFVRGARRAFQTIENAELQKKWQGLPFIGMGIASQVKTLVDGRSLTAAVVTSLTMDRAMEMLAQALETQKQPPENTFVEAASYPELQKLAQ